MKRKPVIRPEDFYVGLALWMPYGSGVTEVPVEVIDLSSENGIVGGFNVTYRHLDTGAKGGFDFGSQTADTVRPYTDAVDALIQEVEE